MIQLVTGNIYSIDEENLSQDMLREFCSGEHENDVLCVSRKGIKVYINVEDIRNQRIDEGCYELLQENVFSNIYSNPHNDGIIPLLDPVEREPIALAKYIETSYQHDYNCDVERIDMAIFDLYESICLYEVNEFSVLMYQQCFKSYKGKIVLFGDKWKYILPYLGAAPEYADVVVISDELALKQEIADKKTMRLSTFASNVAGYRERCEAGWFSYDEILTLIYYFTRHKTVSDQGSKNIYIIDVQCGGLGLVSMVNCFDVPCAYILSKGYIPVISITASDDSIYSDSQGDDIWSKFFKQPVLTKQDIDDMNDVTISPWACVTFSGKWLMQQIAQCGKIDLMKPEYFSDRLSQHINEWRKRILQEPETTLGILIRGTDYVAVRPKGHAVQATPEQIIEKIKELSKEEWCFKNIFVATEDADILMKMQKEYGEVIKYIDQKRFTLQKGEYIAGQKQKDSWKSGDGWKYGADYLCAMVLLSECGSFIASGRCTGTDLVQKLANGRHNRSYIFDLGAYE